MAGIRATVLAAAHTASETGPIEAPIQSANRRLLRTHSVLHVHGT